VQNPENHYVNLHTTVNPGGVIRAQLAPANTALPVVSRGGNAADGTASAPGGLIKISGTNLAKVTDDLSGWRGKTLPSSFDGSKLTIGGKNAAILFVSPTSITAQVPVDAPTGSQPAVVTNSNGAGAATNVTIAAVAPAVFSQNNNSAGGIVTHQNFSLVGPGNPARSGDILIIYATGLGSVTPGLATGALATFPPEADTAPVTVTIGGQDAKVIYSIAAPGAVGLYQIAVTMPPGVASGTAPVVVKIGSASSTAVNVAVQ
jgi:uncharacterized protein (TIGR03437 family)